MKLEERRQVWLWAAVATLLPLLAIPGVFSSSSVFYARDLTSWFFPHHAWFRQTILAGRLPFWNPYLGFGYSTANEPALQTFFPLTLPLRFLPTVLGFNLIVGLPPAVAALGMFVLLARRLSNPAACLGAVVFGASGPMLSTANMPNLSWSCACMPWALASIELLAEARTLRRAALVAVAFGVMLLAGEPVTFFAAGCLGVAYAAFVATPGFRPRVGLAGATALAIALGALLAAVQILPTAAITSESIRSTGVLRDMWSLNPLRLFEVVAPFVFGKYTGLPHEITQWLFVLNDGKEPLLFSLFLGVPALILAALGAASFGKSRVAMFWSVAGVVGLVAALGSHTPVYRGALQLMPALSMFRYPSKYLIVTAMAVSALAAIGWDAAATASRRRLVAPVALGIGLAATALAVLILKDLSPEKALSLAASWASSLQLPNPTAGAESLVHAAAGAAPRLLALATVGCALLLLAASRLRSSRFAHGALFALAACDLIVANGPINPTLDTATLAPFDWVQLAKRHAGDRIFIARDFLSANKATEDIPPPPTFPPDRPVLAHQAVVEIALGGDLSASAVPTVLSREVTGLRPREYFWLLQSFTRTDRAMQYRFLSWAGTRYFLTMSPPPLPSERLAQLPAGAPALYESVPSGSRVFVAAQAEVEPSSQRQVERLFEPGFDPSATVLISQAAMPGPSASGGHVRASIVEDGGASLHVDAEAPASGGYLVMLDSFDPGWSATVDGVATPVLRADGVFRAVSLSPGRHDVRFAYMPEHLRTGAIMSGFATAFLTVIAFRRRREIAVASEPSSAPIPSQNGVPAT